jgi:hypothetical protein
MAHCELDISPSYGHVWFGHNGPAYTEQVRVLTHILTQFTEAWDNQQQTE